MHSSKHSDHYLDFPVLTEVVGEAIEIPTLTEIIADEIAELVAQQPVLAEKIDALANADATQVSASVASTHPMPSSDLECQRIAALIGPQLEHQLRAKLLNRFETQWQDTWRETQAVLPELIRVQLESVVVGESISFGEIITTPLQDSTQQQESVDQLAAITQRLEMNKLTLSDFKIPSVTTEIEAATTGIIPPRIAPPKTPEPSTKKMELAKSFEPQAIEAHWYPIWENAGYFKATTYIEKPAYCIMLPPPNVTGTLHMGHSFQDTLMDALIRYHRMKGDNTLWQPGTDHAGIATQIVVERQLDAKGLSRHDLGREKFLQRVWEWKEESGSTITRQMRRLGASCDWSRERFTMDEGLSEAVTEVFVKLHEQGLIYRGKRLVNWDPVLGTAVSDLEVVAQEEDGSMWHIAYPLETGVGALIVATTRPETLLGDVAVAVHPEDARYKHLIGQKLQLPLCNRTIPIIADDYVDPAFGTGCVKITPARWGSVMALRRSAFLLWKLKSTKTRPQRITDWIDMRRASKFCLTLKP
jgi:hypothetical protein